MWSLKSPWKMVAIYCMNPEWTPCLLHLCRGGVAVVSRDTHLMSVCTSSTLAVPQLVISVPGHVKWAKTWSIYPIAGLLIFRAVAEPWKSGKCAKFCEIHKNTQNTTKFGKNLIKYLSVQHIWNLFQLLGLFTCCKRANLFVKLCHWNKQPTSRNYMYQARLCWEKLGTSHDVKGFAIDSFLEHDQRKTNWFPAKFALKVTTKSAVFNRLLFGEVCSEISGKIPVKSADSSANLSLKIPWYLTFFSATYQMPWYRHHGPK